MDSSQAHILPEDHEWAERIVRERLNRTGLTDGYFEMARENYATEIAEAAQKRAEHLAPLRAFEAGEPHPLDEKFEEMWEGEGGLSGFGFSRTDAESNLALIEKQRAQYEKDADANATYLRSLHAPEKIWRDAIRSHGRSLGINQGIALSTRGE